MRVRRKIKGTADRPRMAAYLSNKHLYIQLIDDTCGNTLVAGSTKQQGNGSATLNIANAQVLGKRIAEAALSVGIQQVVFDRGGFQYAGRMAAAADAAREAGLTI